MGIEPTYPAWKAGVLPLNYTRVYRCVAVLFATTILSIYHFYIFVNTFLKKTLFFLKLIFPVPDSRL